jgi:putative transposase
MATSHSKHFYHGIWTTQNALPVIYPNYEKLIEQALMAELLSLKIDVIYLVIMSDHVHCLFEYHGENGLPFIYKNLKARVSYNINSNNLMEQNLYWEKGYDSYSVSPSSIKNVIEYLSLQKNYHISVSIQDELNEMRNKAGLLR